MVHIFKTGSDGTHPEDALGNLGHPDISLLPACEVGAGFFHQPHHPMLGMDLWECSMRKGPLVSSSPPRDLYEVPNYFPQGIFLAFHPLLVPRHIYPQRSFIVTPANS